MSSVMEDLKQLEDRILARIRELEANVAELEQLREVASRLGILDGAGRDTPPATIRATATTRSRAVRGQSTGTMARKGGARSATIPTGGRSTRRERVLEVVGGEPGISVRELVAQLGVNRTSLYPVVRELVSDGLLHKDGRGLWLASR
jgi:Bacterial regulatory proteins, gntR family